MGYSVHHNVSHKYCHPLAIIDANSSNTKLMRGEQIVSTVSSVVIIISLTQTAEISIFKILAELFFPSHNCVCGTITGE